ncbi:cytochrome c-type biogenesis protein CcmH [Mesobacillus subterraneus]|uniref:cytochrome c-type biogenesis protein CcmH n=1 Tax=Mesobacillus subterraneus TaxID=285983 RepID=UPI00203E7B49|nr:cytochrome c-type biogenesis protein CcmH [Mesobacillus subterraneus]MCM3664521.1 cytochrome c-type biogenesis protein CcmH [Mesobacillus subterraneus]MCM3683963.1 cytochrome c-type biogenesis protein CcmH [Mesobacillus subterraneus]
MKRLGQIILMSLLIFAGLTVFAFAEETGIKDFDFSRPDFQAVVSMLSMEGHGTHDVSNCSVKQIYYDEIAEMMQKGMTKDDVIAYYVDNLGEQVLQAPPQKGFNLTLWITPFVILLLAALLIILLMKKWKKGSMPIAEDPFLSGAAETEAEIVSSMIEAERKKYL